MALQAVLENGFVQLPDVPRLHIAQPQAAFPEKRVQPRVDLALVALVGRALDGGRGGFQPVLQKSANSEVQRPTPVWRPLPYSRFSSSSIACALRLLPLTRMPRAMDFASAVRPRRTGSKWRCTCRTIHQAAGNFPSVQSKSFLSRGVRVILPWADAFSSAAALQR